MIFVFDSLHTYPAKPALPISLPPADPVFYEEGERESAITIAERMTYRAAYDSPAGYALRRNGSCLADEEISCGKTWGDFSACCPKGTSCPSKDSKWRNSICCPGGGNCSNMLKKRPHCANNETWNMFNHKNNFCCEKGQTGFWNRNMNNEGYGCVNGQPDDPEYMVLGPVKQSMF